MMKSTKMNMQYEMSNITTILPPAAEYGDVDVDISVSTCHAPSSVTGLDFGIV